MVFQDIIVNILFNKPTKEIQLSYGCHKRRKTTGFKLNPLTTAKRIKQTLGVGVEFTLVIEVHQKMLVVGTKGCIHLFGVVGDKIIDQPKTDI